MVDSHMKTVSRGKAPSQEEIISLDEATSKHEAASKYEAVSIYEPNSIRYTAYSYDNITCINFLNKIFFPPTNILFCIEHAMYLAT